VGWQRGGEKGGHWRRVHQRGTTRRRSALPHPLSAPLSNNNDTKGVPQGARCFPPPTQPPHMKQRGDVLRFLNCQKRGPPFARVFFRDHLPSSESEKRRASKCGSALNASNSKVDHGGPADTFPLTLIREGEESRIKVSLGPCDALGQRCVRRQLKALRRHVFVESCRGVAGRD
jgi:hypothetical protein